MAKRDPWANRCGIAGPTCAHGYCLQKCAPRKLRGFSLIEILVVLVILGVAIAAVTLGISGAGGGRQLERDAERLGALVTYACEQAELSGRDIGMSVNRGGYRFGRSNHVTWELLRDGELRPRKWSAGAVSALSRDGNRVAVDAEFPEKPQVVCFSSGELTAFRLDLVLPDDALRYRIEGTPDGHAGSHRVESANAR